jgi:hypothetical protein
MVHRGFVPLQFCISDYRIRIAEMTYAAFPAKSLEDAGELLCPPNS